jgi:hypothetical protein
MKTQYERKIIYKLKMLVGNEKDNEKTVPVTSLSRRYFAKLKRYEVLPSYIRRNSSGCIYCKEHYDTLRSSLTRTLDFTIIRNSARALLKIIEKLSCDMYPIPISRFDLFYYDKVRCRFKYTPVYYHSLGYTYPWENSNRMVLLQVRHFLLQIEYDTSSERYVATDLIFFYTTFAHGPDVAQVNSRRGFGTAIRL